MEKKIETIENTWLTQSIWSECDAGHRSFHAGRDVAALPQGLAWPVHVWLYRHTGYKNSLLLECSSNTNNIIL